MVQISIMPGRKVSSSLGKRVVFSCPQKNSVLSEFVEASGTFFFSCFVGGNE